jgi:hypothetical protein
MGGAWLRTTAVLAPAVRHDDESYHSFMVVAGGWADPISQSVPPQLRPPTSCEGFCVCQPASLERTCLLAQPTVLRRGRRKA